MHRIIKLYLGLLLLFVLSGCWSSKTIQHMDYATAIGLDYKDGFYITYIQVLSFSQVAKTETMEIGKSIPVWVGKGQGKTVSEALSSLYRTSQLRVYWGHVRAIVFSDAFARNKQALQQAYDSINRYREIRYNILVYGTKEPLPKILTQQSILNLSPLDTILDSPQDSYEQQSEIAPQYAFRVISEINEPMRATYLPTLATTDESWTENEKKKSMFLNDGAYIMQNKEFKGWFSLDDLIGSKWMEKRTKRFLINVPAGDNPHIAISLNNPRYRIKPYIDKNEVKFNIDVRIKGNVEEMTENYSISKLEAEAAAVVRSQILHTYRKGLPNQTDILNLLGVFYRNQPREWQRLNKMNKIVLKEDTLNKISVKITLIHTGKYKARI
ncbi:Ger(x)C family spore germination protein [Paenibacillus mendelii]|uniref:Ger(X)C family spore germination protein n=1 Tax=Paenibacillus mendelii TaxID=206163 RepID=A0ABV6JGA2_9BACL|nr:Ger(x)C family spore germination protein [Paenibacillus mendelii]MCQ6557791.1 Ger(x)C family spore germination protein [Paenibacillus mendelii]